MKLSEHVDKLRTLIEATFDKQFARLGISTSKKMGLEKLPPELHEKRQRFDEMLENHVDETGSYGQGREKLVDELTFTLFNRIAAIKVMEASNLFPPIITKQSEHGGRSFGHKAWLEIRPDMRSEELEGIREYLKYAFDELGKTLPLYSKDYFYALLPDAISLNEIIDTFNEVENDSQVDSAIWESDDILGWLYESYNNAKKVAFKESKAKTEYHKVSLQSQVYTPSWVVQFLVENSLGKLYLEMYPDSKIKRRFKIANAPKTQERDLKPLDEVRLIDPACGSGNFLLYGFDFFYELYLDQIENYDADYEEEDIGQLIIENNLHGIDLDDRAIQLAQLGLFIKARKKRRTVGELNFKVVSSDFFLPDYEVVRHIFEEGGGLHPSQNELIEEIWGDLQYAYKFGSLIRLDEKIKDKLCLTAEKKSGKQLTVFGEIEKVKQEGFTVSSLSNLKKAVEKYARSKGDSFLVSKTRDAITFLELLTTEYDVATANPPYTDRGDFGPELKRFVEDNYKKPYKFHTNLYAACLKRCYDFVVNGGFVAMVHPPTFMYIKTFDGVREFIVDKTHINFFIEWGYLGMFNPSARVDSAVYILEKSTTRKNDAVFIKLNQLYESKRYDALFEAYDALIDGKDHDLLYLTPQSKLKTIKSYPFIYWISDTFREKFGKQVLGNIFDSAIGLQTSNNERFVRYWWEVNDNEKISKTNPKTKWVPYDKGGPYKKWFGNNWTIVNWDNDGWEVKNFKDKNGKLRSVIRNEKFYFKEGITFPLSGSKGATFRSFEEGGIFDISAPCIFPSKDSCSLFCLLGVLNSKLVAYILDCLNPTVHVTTGDINRLPLVIPVKQVETVIADLTSRNIEISKHSNSFRIYEREFATSPIKFFNQGDVYVGIKKHLSEENWLGCQISVNEAIIDDYVFKIYELTERDREAVLLKEGVTIGSLPVSEEARSAYLGEYHGSTRFPIDNVRDFIQALPATEFSSEVKETILSGFSTLYQKNNNLEQFCICHQINPINVWYWFKDVNVIPQQRMHDLVIEFLADMIREILMEDEDGIIPLVPNAGEKVLLDRIEEKFREKGFTSAQYSSFDSVLGRSIDDYLRKYFFAELSDHLNLFMYLPKTPFIWHLTSGQYAGFDCYIIIYKWSRDKLMRLRSVYIERRERSLINRQSDLANNDSADAQNEKDLIFKQLQEIEEFKVKIDELLTEGYNPILDDGVGKNIAPLQQKKMISYEVLTAGQLKKYLNADW